MASLPDELLQKNKRKRGERMVVNEAFLRELTDACVGIISCGNPFVQARYRYVLACFAADEGKNGVLNEDAFHDDEDLEKQTLMQVRALFYPGTGCAQRKCAISGSQKTL